MAFSMKAKKPNHYLAEDCWAAIMKKLDEQDLESMSRVCKDFLIISGGLQRKLKFLVTNYSASKIFPKLISRFSCLDELHLVRDERCSEYNTMTIDGIIFEMLRVPALNLKALTIICRCNHSGQLNDKLNLVDSFMQLGERMKKLKRLACSVCQIDDNILEQIGNNFPSLEEIHISDACHPRARGVTDHGVELLTSKLKNLKNIVLSGCLSDESIVSICSNSPFLRELTFSNSKRTTIKGLAYLLQHSSNLVSFSMLSKCLPQRLLINQVSSYAIENLVCHARQLQHLAFNKQGIGERVIRAITTCKLPLKELFLSGSYATDLEIELLLNAYPSLSSLGLFDSYALSNHSLEYLSSHLKNLRSITIGGSSLWDNSSFVILVDNCTSLESITMEMTELGRGYFLAKGGINEKIKHLNLIVNPRLNDYTLESIGRICPSLEHLNFKFLLGSMVTERGISQILNLCKKLKVLRLERFRKANFFEVERGFSELNLEELYLTPSAIDDKCLATIWKTCHKLRKLDVSYCNHITIEGVKMLVEKCTELKEIIIKYKLHNSNHEANGEILRTRPWLRISVR